MFPIRQFVDRFGEILAELDALAEECDAGSAEELEDLNAELEDSLLLLSELRPESDDWREELSGTLEELQALAGDYRDLADEIPGVADLAERLERTAATALGGMGA